MKINYLDQFKKETAAWGITISETQLEQFSDYYELLVDWNTRINLTRITEPAAVCRQHFLDSIAPMRSVSFAGRSLIDIGTGAGFPGIPLKIMEPGVELTLLDALEKRCKFLQEVVRAIGLQGVRILHGRAEDHAAHKAELRGQFDYAASRAVAKLNILCEYAVPFLKTGGVFIAYKLENGGAEADGAARALKELRSTLSRRERYTLPETEPARALLFVAKDADTPERYPRRAGMPEKRPL